MPRCALVGADPARSGQAAGGRGREDLEGEPPVAENLAMAVDRERRGAPGEAQLRQRNGERLRVRRLRQLPQAAEQTAGDPAGEQQPAAALDPGGSGGQERLVGVAPALRHARELAGSALLVRAAARGQRAGGTARRGRRT